MSLHIKGQGGPGSPTEGERESYQPRPRRFSPRRARWPGLCLAGGQDLGEGQSPPACRVQPPESQRFLLGHLKNITVVFGVGVNYLLRMKSCPLSALRTQRDWWVHLFSLMSGSALLGGAHGEPALCSRAPLIHAFPASPPCLSHRPCCTPSPACPQTPQSSSRALRALDLPAEPRAGRRTLAQTRPSPICLSLPLPRPRLCPNKPDTSLR